jgi:hypothetical protein
VKEAAAGRIPEENASSAHPLLPDPKEKEKAEAERKEKEQKEKELKEQREKEKRAKESSRKPKALQVVDDDPLSCTFPLEFLPLFGTCQGFQLSIFDF